MYKMGRICQFKIANKNKLQHNKKICLVCRENVENLMLVEKSKDIAKSNAYTIAKTLSSEI